MITRLITIILCLITLYLITLLLTTEASPTMMAAAFVFLCFVFACGLITFFVLTLKEANPKKNDLAGAHCARQDAMLDKAEEEAKPEYEPLPVKYIPDLATWNAMTQEQQNENELVTLCPEGCHPDYCPSIHHYECPHCGEPYDHPYGDFWECSAACETRNTKRPYICHFCYHEEHGRYIIFQCNQHPTPDTPNEAKHTAPFLMSEYHFAKLTTNQIANAALMQLHHIPPFTAEDWIEGKVIL